MNRYLNKKFTLVFLLASLMFTSSAYADPLVDLQILNAKGASGEIIVVAGEDVEVSFDVTLDSGGVLGKSDSLELVNVLDDIVASSKQRGKNTSGSVILTVPAGTIAAQFYVRYVRTDNATEVSRVSHPDDLGSVPLVAIEESSLVDITARVAALEATDPVPGPAGADGLNGADGMDGAPGADGLNGAPGADGMDGAPGADGMDGAPGADGMDGLNGAAGADGLPGADGAIGPQGPEGPPGIQGARTIFVSATGLTPSENGALLLDAVQAANALIPSPSASDPALIILEPGSYVLGTTPLRLTSISLKGFDRERTVIRTDSTIFTSDASIMSVKIVGGALGTAVFGNNYLLQDVIVEGRWAVQANTAVIQNSVFTVDFKCINSGSSGQIEIDGLQCNSGTFADLNKGVDLVIRNSTSTGGINVYDTGGPVVSISIVNSKIGRITPPNVSPLPTQPVLVDIRHSQVDTIYVPFSNLVSTVLFSEIGLLGQSDGQITVSHSIVESLDVVGGATTVVNSQVSNRTVSSGLASCPFSYDSNYQPLPLGCL